MKKRMMMTVAALWIGVGMAAVPLRWEVETSRATPATFEAYSGETLDLEAGLKSYGKPLEVGLGGLGGLEARLYWQTNGMGSCYWTAPAEVACRESAGGVTQLCLRATWSPTNEVGAKAYNCFIGLDSAAPNLPNGGAPNLPNLNYHAAFQLRFRASPGAVPGDLPLPVQEIDFAKVEVVNAPYYAKAEVDTQITALADSIETKADELDTQARIDTVRAAADSAYDEAMNAQEAAATADVRAYEANVAATNALDLARGKRGKTDLTVYEIGWDYSEIGAWTNAGIGRVTFEQDANGKWVIGVRDATEDIPFLDSAERWESEAAARAATEYTVGWCILAVPEIIGKRIAKGAIPTGDTLAKTSEVAQVATNALNAAEGRLEKVDARTGGEVSWMSRNEPEEPALDIVGGIEASGMVSAYELRSYGEVTDGSGNVLSGKVDQDEATSIAVSEAEFAIDNYDSATAYPERQRIEQKADEANVWSAATYNFMTGGRTNCWFSGTNYVFGADAAARTHFGWEAGMDASTVPCSMALWEIRDGARQCVWDQRDWTAWYWSFKAAQMEASVQGRINALGNSVTNDANYAWAKRYASDGTPNPDRETTFIDTPSVTLSPGMRWESVAKVGGAGYWTIVGDGAVIGGSGTNATLQIKDFEGNEIMTVTKGEHRLAWIERGEITGQMTDGDGWVCFDMLADAEPVGHFSTTLDSSDFIPQTDPNCPAQCSWEDIGGGKWRVHFLLKPGISANACFAKFQVEVEGQTVIRYNAGQEITGGLIYNGVRIAPDVSGTPAVGTVIQWKVVH